ncbi:sensor histidine kinase [Streptomyces sp. NPDC059582]|uniref:sensor histidine kinase n=1 Tax=Streptomyces sp. NPDC059582 TaxID=3346875 RepID=UPI0036B69923
MIDVRRALHEHPRIADAALVFVAVGLTVLVLRAQLSDLSVYPQLTSGTGLIRMLPAHWLIGGDAVPLLACLSLFWRRRHPVALALALVAAAVVWPVVVPLLIALFTVAATCPGRTTLRVTGVALLPVPAHLVLAPYTGPLSAATAVSAVALVGAAVGWGLNVAGIRERALRAEADADLRAARARQHAREEIAREMHDVLAHRLTLLSVHAGALEFHRTASPAEVAEAVGVIRQSAGQALEDLQDVLRVLRTPQVDAHAEPPQPTLADLDRLIEEARAAGAALEVRRDVEDPATMDPATSRAAYRILQEALTNHRKHAPRGPMRLSLTGGAQEGLTITARNPVRSRPTTRPTGAGQGLIGMNERAALAGGSMRRVLTATDFSLEIWLPWTR